jgi:hypothetical protein
MAIILCNEKWPICVANVSIMYNVEIIWMSNGVAVSIYV